MIGAIRRFFERLRNRFTSMKVKAKGNTFLCDVCKWNYGDICTRPERPNAQECPDFTEK